MRDHVSPGAMLGTHWIAEATGCECGRLSREQCRTALLALCRELGMTRVSEPQLHEHNDESGKLQSIAGILLIAESHISVHVFPAERTVHVDVFSCGGFDRATARLVTEQQFAPTGLSDQCVGRGQNETNTVNKRR